MEYFNLSCKIYKSFINPVLDDDKNNSDLKVLGEEELVEFLETSKLDTNTLFDSITYKINNISNEINFSKTFNHFKGAIDKLINDCEKIIMDKQEEISEIYCCKIFDAILEKFVESFKTANNDKEFIELLIEMFNEYSKESKGRKKFSVFKEKLSLKWDSIINDLYKRIELNLESERDKLVNEQLKIDSYITKVDDKILKLDEAYKLKYEEYERAQCYFHICDKEIEYLQKEYNDLMKNEENSIDLKNDGNNNNQNSKYSIDED